MQRKFCFPPIGLITQRISAQSSSVRHCPPTQMVRTILSRLGLLPPRAAEWSLADLIVTQTRWWGRNHVKLGLDLLNPLLGSRRLFVHKGRTHVLNAFHRWAVEPPDYSCTNRRLREVSVISSSWFAPRASKPKRLHMRLLISKRVSSIRALTL